MHLSHSTSNFKHGMMSDLRIKRTEGERRKKWSVMLFCLCFILQICHLEHGKAGCLDVSRWPCKNGIVQDDMIVEQPRKTIFRFIMRLHFSPKCWYTQDVR